MEKINRKGVKGDMADTRPRWGEFPRSKLPDMIWLQRYVPKGSTGNKRT